MDKAIKDINNKIDELKQSIEIYQKAKNEINDFYKKLSIKSRYSSNTQFIIDKNEDLCNKKVELNMMLTIPENINLRTYKSKEEEFNLDDKHLNKIITIEDQFEMTYDNNKINNSLNIQLNIPKTNKIRHFYKVLVYIINESNIIYEYLLDDIKEVKNYYLLGKKIQLDENDFSTVKIKSTIYDFYFE